MVLSALYFHTNAVTFVVLLIGVYIYIYIYIYSLFFYPPMFSFWRRAFARNVRKLPFTFRQYSDLSDYFTSIPTLPTQHSISIFISHFRDGWTHSLLEQEFPRNIQGIRQGQRRHPKKQNQVYRQKLLLRQPIGRQQTFSEVIIIGNRKGHLQILC